MKIISDIKKNLRKTIGGRVPDLWRSTGASVTAGYVRPAPLTGAAALLGAASKLYEKGLQKDQARLRKSRAKLPVPVISIGNLSVGGTGKTPITIRICEFLLAAGYRPAVLTRGYGRRGGSPGRVPVAGDAGELSNCFGDEPVMMSAYLPSVPVWVGKDRAATGKAALAENSADLLILDDGFQHLSLERDLDIVLLDCRSPFGNGRLLPVGPLREPPSHLARADAFVITHADGDCDPALLTENLLGIFPGIEVFSCRHRVRGIRPGMGGPVLDLNALLDRRAVAFAGIGGPESFFEDLRKAGMKICSTLGFPDHHRYTGADLWSIFHAASEHGAEVIVTTAKDIVRIPLPCRDAFTVAELDIDFGADLERFRRLIVGSVNR
jgi:tetraacyldisaccharide 4'-kinase